MTRVEGLSDDLDGTRKIMQESLTWPGTEGGPYEEGLRMFTGIVAGTAPIVDIGGDDSVRTFSVDLNGFDTGSEIGASVSLDGVCMTVVNIDNGIVSLMRFLRHWTELPFPTGW